jgi:hypothetical protein
VALASAVAAWLALGVEETLRSATLLFVGPALLVLGAALVLRLPIGVPVALLLLGIAYAVRLVAEEDALDGRAPLVAAAFFAIAELSYWSLELRDVVAEEAGAYLRRSGLLALMTLGALALGVALLALVDVAGTGGVAVEAIGVAAAVATLALLALASRRTAP